MNPELRLQFGTYSFIVDSSSLIVDPALDNWVIYPRVQIDVLTVETTVVHFEFDIGAILTNFGAFELYQEWRSIGNQIPLS